MTRRRLLILSALLLLPLVGFGIYFLTPPKPGVTRENFRRLHKGMTQEEVESILGGKGRIDGLMIRPYLGERGTHVEDWRNQIYISITFDGSEAIGGLCTGLEFDQETGECIGERELEREHLGETSFGSLPFFRRWVKEWTGY